MGGKQESARKIGHGDLGRPQSADVLVSGVSEIRERSSPRRRLVYLFDEVNRDLADPRVPVAEAPRLGWLGGRARKHNRSGLSPLHKGRYSRQFKLPPKTKAHGFEKHPRCLHAWMFQPTWGLRDNDIPTRKNVVASVTLGVPLRSHISILTGVQR